MIDAEVARVGHDRESVDVRYDVDRAVAVHRAGPSIDDPRTRKAFAKLVDQFVLLAQREIPDDAISDDVLHGTEAGLSSAFVDDRARGLQSVARCQSDAAKRALLCEIQLVA